MQPAPPPFQDSPPLHVVVVVLMVLVIEAAAALDAVFFPANGRNARHPRTATHILTKAEEDAVVKMVREKNQTMSPASFFSLFPLPSPSFPLFLEAGNESHSLISAWLAAQ